MSPKLEKSAVGVNVVAAEPDAANGSSPLGVVDVKAEDEPNASVEPNAEDEEPNGSAAANASAISTAAAGAVVVVAAAVAAGAPPRRPRLGWPPPGGGGASGIARPPPAAGCGRGLEDAAAPPGSATEMEPFIVKS